MRFNAFYTLLALVFLLSFILLITSMSSVMINAIKKTVVAILLTTEKTVVTFAVNGENSGKLYNLSLIHI